jgi:hypothetical protein
MKKQGIILIAGTVLAVLTITCFTPKSHADTESPAVQIARLQGEIQKLKVEIAILKPYARRGAGLPLKLEHRKALTSSGLVLEIENYSSETLPVKVTMINPTFGKTNVFDLVLDGAQIHPFVKEIGRLQGWTAAPGDIVQVRCKGYEPYTARIE